MRPKKKYIKEEAISRLRKYCAYRERCHKEVEKKLWEWGFDSSTSGEVIVTLIEENFLNEERFAKAYARGKFKYNQWGRIKIRLGLKERGISNYLCEAALKEINETEYLQCLATLLEKKQKLLKEKNHSIRNKKIYQYLLSKGFEPELIWQEIKK